MHESFLADLRLRLVRHDSPEVLNDWAELLQQTLATGHADDNLSDLLERALAATCTDHPDPDLYL